MISLAIPAHSSGAQNDPLPAKAPLPDELPGFAGLLAGLSSCGTATLTQGDPDSGVSRGISASQLLATHSVTAAETDTDDRQIWTPVQANPFGVDGLFGGHALSFGAQTSLGGAGGDLSGSRLVDSIEVERAEPQLTVSARILATGYVAGAVVSGARPLATRHQATLFAQEAGAITSFPLANQIDSPDEPPPLAKLADTRRAQARLGDFRGAAATLSVALSSGDAGLNVTIRSKSVMDLDDPVLGERIIALLARHGYRPGKITISGQRAIQYSSSEDQ